MALSYSKTLSSLCTIESNAFDRSRKAVGVCTFLSILVLSPSVNLKMRISCRGSNCISEIRLF